VRKPVDYDQFVAAAKELGLYWLVLNEPPPPAGDATAGSPSNNVQRFPKKWPLKRSSTEVATIRCHGPHRPFARGGPECR
jgi:hypothetical protein